MQKSVHMMNLGKFVISKHMVIVILFNWKEFSKIN